MFITLTKQQLNAAALLSIGNSKTDVAKMVGVDRKTLRRWEQQPNFQEMLAVWAKVNNSAMSHVTPEAQEIAQWEDLNAYLASQRFFASQLREIGNRLTPLCVQLIQRIEKGDEEITVKMLPQILKSLAELAEKVSDCYSRATGIEHLLEQLKSQRR